MDRCIESWGGREGRREEDGWMDGWVSGHDSETSSLQYSLAELSFPRFSLRSYTFPNYPSFLGMKRFLHPGEKNNNKIEYKIEIWFLSKRGQWYL